MPLYFKSPLSPTKLMYTGKFWQPLNSAKCLETADRFLANLKFGDFAWSNRKL